MHRVITLFWADMSSYAIENGHRLDRAYKQIKRLTRVAYIVLGVVVTLMLAIGVVTVISLSEDSSNATQIAAQAKTLASNNQKAVQVSRFDSSVRSCDATDERNAVSAAQIRINDAGHTALTQKDLALLDDEIPQRGQPGSNPHQLSDSQQVACYKYSSQQTALNIPQAFAPAPPPSTTTPLTSTTPLPLTLTGPSDTGTGG